MSVSRFLRRFVFDEVPNLIGRRNSPPQVDVDAAQELFIARETRVRDVVALHLAEDVVVNKVLSLDSPLSRRGKFPAHLFRKRTGFRPPDGRHLRMGFV